MVLGIPSYLVTIDAGESLALIVKSHHAILLLDSEEKLTRDSAAQEARICWLVDHLRHPKFYQATQHIVCSFHTYNIRKESTKYTHGIQKV